MPYVSPTTVVAGTTGLATWGNSVKAAADYLANPPACRVYHNANQSLVDNAQASLAFNSERFDTATMHDTVTNNSRITFTVAGVYVVSACFEIAAAADYTATYCGILLNGATFVALDVKGTHADAGIAPGFVTSTIYKFAAGDYVEVKAFQNNSANAARNVLSNNARSPEFSAVWVGLG